MFDDLYTKIVKTLPYKPLIFLPIIFSVLMVSIALINGIPMSVDFKGGTWIEITSTEKIDLNKLEFDLKNEGLEDLKLYLGRDLETNKTKLTIVTTTLLNETKVKPILKKQVGEIFVEDIAYINLTGILFDESILKDKLKKRFKDKDVTIENSNLEIKGFDLNKGELIKALDYYLNLSNASSSADTKYVELNLEFKERNLIIDNFDPFLGRDFWIQGIQTLFISYILMIIVVFIAFRDFVPSIAVILAATCDILAALGFMSLLKVQLDPSSLTALIMLIGYSVDTDILLTTRVLRRKTGEVNDRISDAMKTGLTMSITAIIVMFVVILFSNFLISMGITQITKLTSLALILSFGLFADMPATWLMNAGILKWYVEEKGGKFKILQIFKLKKRIR